LARAWQNEPATKREASDEFGKTLYGSTQDADREVVERVDQIADARGIPRAQAALAWLLQKPAVTAPIIGETKLQHLDDASGSLGVKLSPQEIAALEEPYVPHRVVEFR
jgi:aryl-alcohol dehydrogenase-like predicted oxidoreductase